MTPREHYRVSYGANFGPPDQTRAEVYIDQGDWDANKGLFDALLEDCEDIEHEYGDKLEWQRLDEKRACRIRISTDGSIQLPKTELDKRRVWIIEHLLRMKEIFGPRIQSLVS